jgi:Asp-tRNA(Asn)/Glu-tRNA(Gln) amidotransferase A subunit family amidase
LSWLFPVLVGYDAADPFSVPAIVQEPRTLERRIGVWEQFYSAPVHSEIREAVRSAAKAMGDMGFPVEEFRPEGLQRAPNVWASIFQLRSPEVRGLIAGHVEELHWTARESLPRKEQSLEDVVASMVERDRLRASFLRQTEGIAAILMPVCAITAFRHRERRWLIEGREIGLFQATLPAVVANVLGLPAVTIPWSKSSEGLPIGVQLMGRPFCDSFLLELAAALENHRPAS